MLLLQEARLWLKGEKQVKVVWKIRFLVIQVRTMLASTEYFQGRMDEVFDVWLKVFWSVVFDGLIAESLDSLRLKF
jgi:hypothetical protein